MTRRTLARVLLASVITGTSVLASSGCARAGIALREQFGYAKREQLVDRVADARDAQEEAKEQFTDALAAFQSVVEVDGGELEERYEAMQAAHERSAGRASRVRDRIGAIESVADALFDEWRSELDDFTSTSARAASERQLADTERGYEQLRDAMQTAADRMDPVLAAMNDQVLLLKHSLNARAVASLSDELEQIETDVSALVQEMQASIDEANAFIDAMQRGSA